jgi:hypothetical protein
LTPVEALVHAVEAGLHAVEALVHAVKARLETVESPIKLNPQIIEVGLGSHLVGTMLGKMGHQSLGMIAAEDLLETRVQGMAGRLNG